MTTASPLPVPGRSVVLADALVAAWRGRAYRSGSWPETGTVAGSATAVTSPTRTLATDALLVLTGAAIVALLAQVEIPLPLVPITGQTLGVLVVGSALGARRGAAALLTYAAVGLAGLPVFAGFAGGLAQVLSPSFGYVLGFVPAAALAGFAAERAHDRRVLRAFAAFLAASAVPFLVGVPYLAAIVNLVLGEPMGVSAALAAGLWPFVPGGIVKALLAAGIVPLAWRGVRALDARR